MKKKIRGTVVPFNVWSDPIPGPDGGFRERFERGAFKDALEKGAPVALKYEHGLTVCKVPLANTADGNLRAWESENGLEVEGVLPDTFCGRKISEGIERGDYRAMSVGFIPVSSRFDALRKRRFITSAIPTDASVVSQPAYPGTSLEVRSLDGARNAIDAYLPTHDTASFWDTFRMVRGAASHGIRTTGECWLRQHRERLLTLAEQRHFGSEKIGELENYFQFLGIT